jgi:hypothetical protein
MFRKLNFSLVVDDPVDLLNNYKIYQRDMFKCTSSDFNNWFHNRQYKIKNFKISFNNAFEQRHFSHDANNTVRNEVIKIVNEFLKSSTETLTHLLCFEIPTFYRGYQYVGKRINENNLMFDKIYNISELFLMEDIVSQRKDLVSILNNHKNLTALHLTAMGLDEFILMSLDHRLLNKLKVLKMESFYECYAMSLKAFDYIALHANCLHTFYFVCEYTSNPNDRFNLYEIHLIYLLQCNPLLESIEIKCRGFFTDDTLNTIIACNKKLRSLKLFLLCKARSVILVTKLIDSLNIFCLYLGVCSFPCQYQMENAANIMYQNIGNTKTLILDNNTKYMTVNEIFLIFNDFQNFFMETSGFSSISLVGVNYEIISQHIKHNNANLCELKLKYANYKKLRLSELEVLSWEKSCEMIKVC